ncbi:flippase [Thiohalomonas denitrificans]|uniref:Membrane protein involved in the export of O-antigen and teichoic acid n=1 Tax=Thiohalomonas denitrificans TaxID=415747 RepID=A0A1G5R079_9GAMM|nr:flippase [Thiohalomonas denitrificans]SCZ67248.1 Membrane protein involved in the export of O-antigen and teichoic acid [Thiohalomonas denitrificans]
MPKHVRAQLIKLTKHHGFVRYFKNTAWLLLEKVLRIVVGLLVGVWIARYLGSEQFGTYSYVMSLVGMFAAVATLGLDAVVVRKLVFAREKHEHLVGTAFALKLVAAACLYLLLVAYSVFAAPREAKELLLIMGAVVFFHAFYVMDFYFQSIVKSRSVVFASTLALLSASAVRVCFILMNAPLVWFGWAFLLEVMMFAAGLLYFYSANRRSIRQWVFEKNIAIDLLKASLPLVLTAFSASVYMKIDQIMLLEMVGANDVGQYAAAVRLSEAFYFIPIAITGSVFPAILRAKEIDVELYRKRLKNLYSLVVWIAIAVALPVTFLSDSIIGSLYGAEYASASSVLVIHIWAGVFFFLNAAFVKFLYSESYEKKYLYRSVFGAAMNIGLNFVLIPSYGIQGAAFATLLSLAAMNYLYDVLDRDLRKHLNMKVSCFDPRALLTVFQRRDR